MRASFLSVPVVLGIAIFCGTPALAADYPYSGVFTASANPDAASPDDLAHCALSFFSQAKDGHFVNYVADMNGFNTSQTLRYLVSARGSCSYDASHRLETCLTEFDTDPANKGAVNVDVVDQISADFIKLSYFDTAAHARDYYATGTGEARSPGGFFRCPFDPNRLAAAISTQVTGLSPDKALQLMSPDAALLHAPITQDLMKAAGLSKP